MKQNLTNRGIKIFAILIMGLFVTSSVSYSPVENMYYNPVYMKRADMEKAVGLQTNVPVKNPGKIYLHNNYILLNELYEGIHIIDNSDPSNPVKVAFIHIDGCVDMAVKDNIIYADNAVDLIAIKVSDNFQNIEVTERIRNIFPEFEDPFRQWSTHSINLYRPEDGILVAWKKNF
ncbi:MAG: hypothetical protein PHP31_06455 [Lentimicrobiaceae bacterium]|nr:hypothetical protein [Lentimicrobiaceae bacterium]